MLLITALGERLMQPDYGTSIPLMIFEESSSSLQDAIQQEVSRAFSSHEPRLQVLAVDVAGIGSKEIRITITLRSRLDQRPFQVSTSFVKS
jgi:phage baseplate assembly protein W